MSLALLAVAGWAAGAGAATFSNPAPIAIPSVGAAAPYPSQITVSGQTAAISDLNVNLNGFSHNAPGDVRVLLVGPGGHALLLMACAGNDQSPGASNANLKLDDTSGILLPAFPSAVFSGTYRPTSYCTAAPSFPSPAPASYANPGPGAGGGATLASIFNNSGANGPWSLFVADGFVGGDPGAPQFAGGWSLEISPDPVTTQQSPDPVPTQQCKKGFKLKKVKGKKKCVRKKKKRKK